MEGYKLLPSLLSADVTRLGEEVEAVLAAGADMIHIDVMDNHYVPNLTFGPLVCEALSKRFPKLPLDVHLMASPVDALIEAFAAAGATRLSIHPEATLHLDRSLCRIKDLHCLAGLVLNPTTSLETLSWCVNRLDFVLIMTVNPGFGGQSLIPDMIKKIETLHALYPHLPIAVDGGVNIDNMAALAKAGARQFIMGSAIFHAKDYRKTFAAIHKLLSKG